MKEWQETNNHCNEQLFKTKGCIGMYFIVLYSYK